MASRVPSSMTEVAYNAVEYITRSQAILPPLSVLAALTSSVHLCVLVLAVHGIRATHSIPEDSRMYVIGVLCCIYGWLIVDVYRYQYPYAYTFKLSDGARTLYSAVWYTSVANMLGLSILASYVSIRTPRSSIRPPTENRIGFARVIGGFVMSSCALKALVDGMTINNTNTEANYYAYWYADCFVREVCAGQIMAFVLYGTVGSVVSYLFVFFLGIEVSFGTHQVAVNDNSLYFYK